MNSEKKKAYLAAWAKAHREHLREYHRSWRRKNPEYVRAAAREWRRRNPEKVAVRTRRWREQNRERMKFLVSRWKKKNREHVNEMQRARYAKDPKKHCAYARRWSRKNYAKVVQTWRATRKRCRERVRLECQRRHAMRMKQLHSGNDKTKELKVYLEAAEMSGRTGRKYQVDHIIPLKCGGWHHHLNLQILTVRMNSIKRSDPFWERKGYKSWRDVPRYLWPEKLIAEYLKRS